MAVTQNSYTGNASTTDFSFTFPYIKSSEVKASLDGTVTTDFSLTNATTVKFDSAPGNNVKILIYRETDDADNPATFYAGSAIKASDLNNNFDQNLYLNQEAKDRYVNKLDVGSTQTINNDIELGKGKTLIFEGATEDAYETTLTVADPTADRTITLPNVTGTVVTDASTDIIDSDHYKDGSIDLVHMSANSVDSDQYVDGSIDTAHIADSQITTAKIAADAITGAKIADGAVDSEHLVADSIDAEHYAAGSVDATALATNAVTTVKITDANVTTAKIAADAVTGAKIADDAIDSEHYTDGSIDTAHIADANITTAKIADDAVTAAKLGTVNLADLTNVHTASPSDGQVLKWDNGNSRWAPAADAGAGGATLADGDYGDVTVSSSGSAINIDSGAVVTAKLGADAVTGAKIADEAIDSEHYTDGSIDHEHLANDAVDGDNIADNSINSEHYVDGSIDTDHIADDQVTYAKIQNVTATDRILGRDSSGAGVIEEITPANLRTMINVADGANAYTHPNHTGEVTSTADGATVIADNIVDEANLKVSNAPTNGHFLSAQSGDTGGLTWATAYGPTFRAYMDGDQVISTATDTTIEIDTESFDSDSMYNTSTYKFEPTTNGYYYLFAKIHLSVGTQNHNFAVTIVRDPATGSDSDEATSYTWNENFDTELVAQVVTIVKVEAADKFYVNIYQGSGSNKTVESALKKTTFQGHFIRPI